MIQKIVHRLLMTGFVAFFSSLSLMAQHRVEWFLLETWISG